LWAGKGRLFREGYDLFSNPSWVAVCLGQGIVPDSWEPAVDALDENLVAQALEQMRAGYADVAARLPSHGDFLRMTAPSPLAPAMVQARKPDGGFDFARAPGGGGGTGPLL
jgi:tryptophan halogenase